MRKALFSIAALALLLPGATACGGSDSNAAEPKATSSSSSPARAAAAAKRTTTVKVTSTRYGPILADGRGRALYLFTRETGPAARCYGACADAWPVFYARGKVRAGAGADRRLIGTTRRNGGRRQVTYGGHPLYYYVADRKPGQVTCQDVTEYGGTWLVVSRTGRAIRSD